MSLPRRLIHQGASRQSCVNKKKIPVEESNPIELEERRAVGKTETQNK